MFYYTVSGKAGCGLITDDEKSSRENRESERKLAKKFELYSENFFGSYYFLFSVSGDHIKYGILSYERFNYEIDCKELYKELGFNFCDEKIEEVTLETISGGLNSSCRSGYIEDDDAVLDRFNLLGLTGYAHRNYGERIIDKTTEERIEKTVKQYLCKDSFLPEIERIRAGKSNCKAKGHPVHYMIETDSRDSRKILYRCLIQSLYMNDRVESRRYSFVDFKPGENVCKGMLEDLYNSSEGATIVIRYEANDDSEETNHAMGDFNTISDICEIVTKYRNTVLTIICLPRACEKSKSVFFESMGCMSVIEIKEEFAVGDKAKEYLKMLARENKIRTDNNLLNKVEDGKSYLGSDLSYIFDEWYGQKLKSKVYPQYKDIDAVSKSVIKEKPKGDAYSTLSEMIGLNEAKSVINKAINYYKMQKLCREKGMQSDHPAMHMVFTGNPGTAKTTVARLFAQIMKDNGLVSKGQLIEVGRSDLVGKYVGWTAQIVKEKFKAAKGGMLFIDEAYSLCDDKDGLYGDEAINTIVQEMENMREEVVVIFAGYPDKMEKFLQKNPGLRSRIAFHVPFDDYNSEELCDIADLIGKSKGFRISDGAREKLRNVFESAKENNDFGNGRYVRNVLEQARMNQASRLISMDFESITKDSLATIEDVDIANLDIGLRTPERHIGFVQ